MTPSYHDSGHAAHGAHPQPELLSSFCAAPRGWLTEARADVAVEGVAAAGEGEIGRRVAEEARAALVVRRPRQRPVRRRLPHSHADPVSQRVWMVKQLAHLCEDDDLVAAAVSVRRPR